jgi:glycosyltransferase involved in cell wall biosynthesis
MKSKTLHSLQQLQLAFVTPYDARDVRSWSGIPYHMSRAFAEGGSSVEYIGPLKKELSSRVGLNAKKAAYKLLGQKYLADWDKPVLKGYAQQISKSLSQKKADFILSTISYPFAFLESEVPFGFWCDGTYAAMIDYYQTYKHLCSNSIQTGLLLENSIFQRAKLAIFASDWAAKSALNDYQVDESKVHVVPMGANIECHRNIQDIKDIISARPQHQCNLLFMGVEWNRKGGAVALEVAQKLNESGLRTELTIVGCAPIVDGPLPDYVKPLGFISKSTQEGFHRLHELFEQSHFLIVPSRAECYGIVFCEANSYGLPSLGTRTGGISTLIRDNVNGHTFALDASTDEYCSFITEFFGNRNSYTDLALSSFNEYQTRLNWSVATQTVERLIREAR